MPVYRSGRQRRLVVNGSWQCPIRVEYRCTREWPLAPNRYATFSERWPELIEVRALGMAVKYAQISSFGSFPANTTCTNLAGGSCTVVQTVIVGEGLSYEQTRSGSTSFNYTAGDMAEFLLDPGADYTFWADVDEWFEVIDPIQDSDSAGFPEFGGAAVADSVTGRGIRFFERLRVGGEMGVTVSGLVPRSLSVVTTPAISDELGDIEYALDRRGKVFAENDTSQLVVSGLVGGLGIRSDYHEITPTSVFDGRFGFNLWLTKGVGESGESYAYSWAVPDLELHWRGDVFVGTQLLFEPLTVNFEMRAGGADILPLVGSRVEDWSQGAWEGFASLDGSIRPSLSFDDRAKLRHWIDGASLAENGDQRADWRMQFRGKEWLSFTASHAEEVVLDDGNSAVGWSGDGVTVSAGVMIAVGGLGGTAVRSFSPVIVSESYRYLDIEVRSFEVGGLGCKIAVGSKNWSFLTGPAGVWVTRRVDLCHPENLSVEWDDKESRYPLDEFGDVVDSEHWGVSTIEAVSFEELEADSTYEIRSIALRRAGSARLSFLPCFRGWIPENAAGADYVKPLIWSEVDGRIADLYGMRRTGGSVSWPNLTDLSNRLSALGWFVNPGVAVGDGYHGNLLAAELVWGGGIRAGDGGIPGCDRVVGAGLPVYAAALWDEVELYPGCGEVWESGGGYGGRTDLYSGKVMRSQAWGLTLGDESPRPGELCELVADGEVRGIDASDSQGFFLTGLAGGLESPGHEVIVGGLSSGEFETITRMRHRRVFRELASAGAVSFDWHLAGMAVRASTSPAGVRVAIKGNGEGAEYTVRSVGFGAASLSVRWDTGRKLRLILVTEEDGQIRERFSDDLGETWSMAETLAVGNVRFPGLFVHQDGRRFVYWIEAGSVNGVIRDRSGGVLSSITAARSGVSEFGLAVGGLDQAGGRVSIELVTIEDDSIISSLSTDGLTFS